MLKFSLLSLNFNNVFFQDSIDSDMDIAFDVLDNISEFDNDSWNHWWANELAIDFSSMGQVITVADNVTTVRGLSDVMICNVVYIIVIVLHYFINLV
jgi:hypothetical protein